MEQTRLKNTGLIAGVIVNATKENIIPQLIKAKKLGADLAEIRVDLFQPQRQNKKTIMGVFSEIYFQRNYGAKISPIIATVRRKKEGGRFKKKEERRLIVFMNIISYLSPGDFVDIELKASPKVRDAVIEEAKKQGLKVIVSYHNLKKTPPYKELENIIEREIEIGADVAKVAVQANDTQNVFTLQKLLDNHKDKKVIILPMGEKWKSFRLLVPFLNKNYINYGIISGASAQGQPTVKELRDALDLVNSML